MGSSGAGPSAVGFSLSRGGPFHRLLEALRLLGPRGLVSVRGAIALGLFAWLPLLVLALVERHAFGGHGALLADVHAWVTFLGALPLLLLAEHEIDLRLGMAVDYLHAADMVGERARPALDAALAELRRSLDERGAELLLAVIAYAATVPIATAGATSWKLLDAATPAARLSLAGWWSTLVSVPLATFLLLRWLWRIALWARFLARLARAPLRLVPLHPDRLGGLGAVEAAHASVALVALAVSASAMAGIATRVLRTGAPVLAYKPLLVATLLLPPLLFMAPLIVFAPALRRQRLRCLERFGVTGAHFGRAYDARWLDRRAEVGPDELGSPEHEAFSGLSESFTRASATRRIPIGNDTVLLLLMATGLPILVLLATEIPLGEILRSARVLLG